MTVGQGQEYLSEESEYAYQKIFLGLRTVVFFYKLFQEKKNSFSVSGAQFLRFVFSVEGLLGVTVDETEVFLINVNELVTEETLSKQVTMVMYLILLLRYSGYRLQRIRVQRAPDYTEQISLHENH